MPLQMSPTSLYFRGRGLMLLFYQGKASPNISCEGSLSEPSVFIAQSHAVFQEYWR